MIGIKRGDDDLADLALSNGIAGAGPDDFQDQILADDHALARRGLKGDQPEIGGAERLIGIDAARSYFVLQRLRKRRAGHQRALDRGHIAAGARSRIEQDLEEIGGSAITDRAIGLDQLELRVGVAGAGRNYRATQRTGRAIEDEASRGQMIAEGVEHHVARAKPCREHRPRPAPGVGVSGLGLEDRAGRRKQPSKRAREARDKAAERRRGLVQGRQVGLAQHRQARQCRPAGDAGGIEAPQPLGIARCGHGLAQHPRQPRKQLRLALGGVASLTGVVVVGHYVAIHC